MGKSYRIVDRTHWHPNSVRLDLQVLAQLVEQDKLQDETLPSIRLGPGGGRAVIARAAGLLFPYSPTVPPSVRPKPQAARPRRSSRRTAVQVAAAVAATVAPGLPTALVIQIVPHHNGEVFLSKRAVNEYPVFFGFPFTGRTVPKTPGNKPYPQRSPDPVTEWKIYDRQGRVFRSLEDFRLKHRILQVERRDSYYYPTRCSEANSSQINTGYEASVRTFGVDYQCEVFPPDSAQYRSLLPACNETMPAGGSGTPRKFGGCSRIVSLLMQIRIQSNH